MATQSSSISCVLQRFNVVVGLVTLIHSIHSGLAANESLNYLVGLGSYDVTGPAADVNMMGYANPGQSAGGIHMRLRARTFIVAEPSSTADGNRVVFVNVDACMGAQGVTLRVLSRLKERYGGLYTEKNVAISGTHTHSGPGGYLHYVLYIITSMGFVQQSFDALADGIVQSIIQAHENLRPGSIFFNEGEVLGANINRSPSAYLCNPADERAKYVHNVDKNMSLLKFVDAEWGEVGAFSWFPVHGTSMNRTNELLSGDNKGAAARFMEDWHMQRDNNNPLVEDAAAIEFAQFEGTSKHPRRRISNIVDGFYNAPEGKARTIAARLTSLGGQPTTKFSNMLHRVRSMFREPLKPLFTAAFCQSNVGDTTPNVLGAFCIDTDLPCDFNHSTCNGRNELCIGRGPAYPEDHFSSTKIIAELQSQKAINLFETATKEVMGKIAYRQAYIDFSSVNVTLPPSAPGLSGKVVTTCPAAVGFSFAAGTTDGPGAFSFTQGDNKGNLFWRLVGSALKAPSQEQIECQKPKPILIDTGDMFTPYAWAPAILPIQILRIGQVIILAVPGEFTTMAGRRLREAVKMTLLEKGNGKFGQGIQVILAGLTNTYSQYVTTLEEYEFQRYEGASTLYGPHTLSAYIQEFKKLATALAEGSENAPGPSPPDLFDQQMGFLPGVVADGTPLGVKFGDMKQDIPRNSSYRIGDAVQAVFYTGCPRNDLYTEGTFALVEILDAAAVWQPAYDDDDWSVKFIWSRPLHYSTHSYATIVWEVPDTARPGVYRIRHFGANKHIFGAVKHFTGTSRAFVVTA